MDKHPYGGSKTAVPFLWRGIATGSSNGIGAVPRRFRKAGHNDAFALPWPGEAREGRMARTSMRLVNRRPRLTRAGQNCTPVNNYAGVILQDSPRFTGNFTDQHRFNLPNGSTLTPQLDVFFKGTYWVQGDRLSVGNWGAATAFDPGSPLKQGAYHLLNANLTWQSADRRFTVTGHVRNIENKAILSNIGTDFSNGLTFMSLNAPRTFGVSVNAAL
jgi:hypothetical protein